MNTVIKTLATLALLGAAAGGSVVFLGLYNTSARDGHWPGVGWVLHTTFRNGVELRAPAPEEVPELTDAMAALGARHYESACRVCHAAPGEETTATMRAMTPRPPPIAEAVGDWQPNELGYIVREGVKMSGMPGWPSARDDEVWPVVAFLTRVQQMGASDYEALVENAPADGPEGLAFCAGCHGIEGRSGNPHIPRLDIQTEAYLAMSLQAYREGRRQSGIMAQAASAVPETALAELARHFASAEVEGEAQPSPQAEAGRALAFAETGNRDVPACHSCHGPEAERENAEYPSLSGQFEPYLIQQLKLWRDGPRGGGPRAQLMRKAAEALDDDEIAALAAYYASLPPAKPGG